MCGACAEAHDESNQKSAAAKEAMHRCKRCGRKLDEDPYKTCWVCRKAGRERYTRIRVSPLPYKTQVQQLEAS
jgi:hypothetical protein